MPSRTSRKALAGADRVTLGSGTRAGRLAIGTGERPGRLAVLTLAALTAAPWKLRSGPRFPDAAAGARS